MTVKNLYSRAKNSLKNAGVAEPEASASFLLRSALKISKNDYLIRLNAEVSKSTQKKYEKMISRRLHHEPVWQIVGSVEFWNRDFYVNKNVLVPRPETEFLIQEALNTISKYQIPNTKYKLLDVGTGSGAIAVTLAKELPESKIFASDISGVALKVAKRNAKINKAKVVFKKGSLFTPWKNQKFHLICANLPYIPTEDLGGLALDIHHYEPRLALDGGMGGLVLYKDFLAKAPNYLVPGGAIICEIGAGQGKEFKKIAKEHFPKAKVVVKKDLASYDRIVIIEI
jgi:release factor glutamine methyltransferase